ncbi:hypothetical protein SMICM17S_05170 [Streptomyces microflavus]
MLLDPEDRILLLHGHEPDDPADDWWFTPGGGVEGDETREQAALRELAEETGITEVELGPVLWQRQVLLPLRGPPLGPGRVVLPGPHRPDGHRGHGPDRAGAAQRRGSALVDVSGTDPGT